MNADQDETLIIEIEEDYDPKWKAALLALQGWDPSSKTYKAQSEPRHLAELLMAGEPMPIAVSQMLATMLLPHDDWKGGRLSFQRPKSENLEKLWERARLAAAIQKLNAKLVSEDICFESRAHTIKDKFKIPYGTAVYYMGIDDQTKFKKYILPISPGIPTTDDSKN